MSNVPVYTWPVAIALIVLGLVQFLKSPSFPLEIPPRARPWLALALGVIGGVAAAIVSGRSVLEAVVTGITGGTGATGVFELASSTKPTAPSPPPPAGPPTDTPPPPPPPADPFRSAPGGILRVAFAALAVLLATGCGAAQQVERVVQVSSKIIERAEPCLMVQYEAAQKQCLALPTDAERRGCVADARAMWKPIIDGLGELRTVRCGLEPQKCEEAK